jgi:hypothetical protein
MTRTILVLATLLVASSATGGVSPSGSLLG